MVQLEQKRGIINALRRLRGTHWQGSACRNAKANLAQVLRSAPVLVVLPASRSGITVGRELLDANYEQTRRALAKKMNKHQVRATNAELERFRALVRHSRRRSRFWKMLRDELRLLGHWKALPRGSQGNSARFRATVEKDEYSQ